MSLTKIQQTLRAEQIPRSKSFLFKLTSVSIHANLFQSNITLWGLIQSLDALEAKKTQSQTRSHKKNLTR